jgi:hypothetical protein
MDAEGERVMGGAQRAELRAANTELLRIDLRISRLETVLKQILGEADNHNGRRVEPHRMAC